MKKFEYKEFTMSRGKGVVWVCDVKDSTKLLNDDDNISTMEEYLTRLHWVSSIVVNSFQGKLIKWTGDGFLAWFNVEDDTIIDQVFNNVVDAAYQLSLINNITQLGLHSKNKISIKHGLTYEKNARVITIEHNSGYETKDIIGRDVVLAFRLTGLSTSFPNISTVRELAKVKEDSFAKRLFSNDEVLKYFKGETRSTKKIYVFKELRSISNKKSELINTIESAIGNAEGRNRKKDRTSYVNSIKQMIYGFENGPHWCAEMLKVYTSYIKDDLLTTLKQALNVLKNSKR